MSFARSTPLCGLGALLATAVSLGCTPPTPSTHPKDDTGRPTLGVLPREIGGELVVLHVYANGPADEAGLRVGDVLVQVGGHDVRTRRDLDMALTRSGLATPRPLGYRRDGEMLETGALWGCFNLAGMYAAGYGVPTDASRANALYARVCEAGDGEACFKLAARLKAGAGAAPPGTPSPEALLRGACEGGYVAACDRSNPEPARGIGPPDVQPDPTRLATLRAGASCVGAWRRDTSTEIQYHSSADPPARCRETLERQARATCPPPKSDEGFSIWWTPVLSIWIDAGEGRKPDRWQVECPPAAAFG